jgi:hypothetical protein
MLQIKNGLARWTRPKEPSHRFWQCPSGGLRERRERIGNTGGEKPKSCLSTDADRTPASLCGCLFVRTSTADGGQACQRKTARNRNSRLAQFEMNGRSAVG